MTENKVYIVINYAFSKFRGYDKSVKCPKYCSFSKFKGYDKPYSAHMVSNLFSKFKGYDIDFPLDI